MINVLMNGFFRKLLLSISLVLLLVSCDTAWNLDSLDNDILFDQQYFVPVGSAYAKLSDAMESADVPSQLSVSGDTIFFDMHGSFTQSLPSLNMPDFLPPFSTNFQPFTDVNVPGGYLYIPVDSVIPEVSSTFTVSFPLNNSLKNQQIDSAYFKTASLAIRIDPSQMDNLDPTNLEIDFEFLKNISFKNGSKTRVHYPTRFGSAEYMTLNDFYLLTQDGTNSVTIKTTVKFRQNRTRVVRVNKNSGFNFTTQVVNLNLDAVFGFFNLSEYNGKTSIDLPLDDLLPGSAFKLGDPKLWMNTSTNVGVNTILSLDTIALISTNGIIKDKRWAMFGASPKFANQLDFPAYLHHTVYNTFPRIDKDYGQLDKAFGSDLTLSGLELTYSFAKPKVLQLPEFLTTDAFVTLNYRFNAPLYFNNGAKLFLSSEIKHLGPDFNHIFQDTLFQKLGMVLDVKNEFPFELDLQMNYLDGSGNSLNAALHKDPEFKDLYVINAPDIDATGHVIRDSIQEQRIFYQMNKMNFAALKKVDRIRLDITARTAPSKEMYFSMQDRVSFKLGAFVKGNYTLEF